MNTFMLCHGSLTMALAICRLTLTRRRFLLSWAEAV